MAAFKALVSSHLFIYSGFRHGFLPFLPPGTSKRRKAAQSNRAKENSLALFRKQHRELHDDFAKELEELARTCAAKGLDIEAVEIRRLAAPLDTRVLGLDPLPTSIQLELPADLTAEERVWRNHLQALPARSTAQATLHALAGVALNAGHVSLAYDLVREVATQDPDNKAARHLLGYEPQWR